MCCRSEANTSTCDEWARCKDDFVRGMSVMRRCAIQFAQFRRRKRKERGTNSRLADVRILGSTNSDAQISAHKSRRTNLDAQISTHKSRRTDSDAQIQAHKFRRTNSDSQISGDTNILTIHIGKSRSSTAHTSGRLDRRKGLRIRGCEGVWYKWGR